MTSDISAIYLQEDRAKSHVYNSWRKRGISCSHSPHDMRSFMLRIVYQNHMTHRYATAPTPTLPVLLLLISFFNVQHYAYTYFTCNKSLSFIPSVCSVHFYFLQVDTYEKSLSVILLICSVSVDAATSAGTSDM